LTGKLTIWPPTEVVVSAKDDAKVRAAAVLALIAAVESSNYSGVQRESEHRVVVTRSVGDHPVTVPNVEQRTWAKYLDAAEVEGALRVEDGVVLISGPRQFQQFGETLFHYELQPPSWTPGRECSPDLATLLCGHCLLTTEENMRISFSWFPDGYSDKSTALQQACFDDFETGQRDQLLP
jgi:hypothetical protein